MGTGDRKETVISFRIAEESKIRLFGYHLFSRVLLPFIHGYILKWMQQRERAILIGGGVGLAYFLLTFILVFALSGFAFNLGMLFLLPFNGFAIAMGDFLASAQAKIFGVSFGAYGTISYEVPLANIIIGAVSGWIFSFKRDVSRKKFIALLVLTQFLAGLLYFVIFLRFQ
jgi:hypothetical protein